MIGHLQDWDNEAVTNPIAGWIWGNLGCHHPEGEISLPAWVPRLSLPPFFSFLVVISFSYSGSKLIQMQNDILFQYEGMLGLKIYC